MKMEDRVQAIFGYLSQHPDRKITLHALLANAGLQPGSTNSKALARAAVMAREAGMQLVPASPQNGYTYMLTTKAAPGVRPSVHLLRIASGVNKRAGLMTQHITEHIGELPPVAQPVARAVGQMQRAAEAQSEAMATVLDLLDSTMKAEDQAAAATPVAGANGRRA